MSKLDRRIESLGKRLGAFAATAKFRVTEWGPVREIHVRERVGGRFIWRLTEATRAIKKRETLAGKLRHLARLKSEKRYVEKIMHYIHNKYPNNPDVVQKANDIYKQGGAEMLIDVLEDANKKSWTYSWKRFTCGKVRKTSRS